MRINVYAEELPTGEGHHVEIVTADYVSSRTGLPMTNYGLRIFLESSPKLHYIPGRDDDRSAVTFWCGSSKKNVFAFLEMLTANAKLSEADMWRDKTAAECQDAETSEHLRQVPDYDGKASHNQLAGLGVDEAGRLLDGTVDKDPHCGNGHRLDYPSQVCNLCLSTMEGSITGKWWD